ncbi:MAG: outer membrane beta-barrel protein [Gemmataceae bacterium]
MLEFLFLGAALSLGQSEDVVPVLPPAALAVLRGLPVDSPPANSSPPQPPEVPPPQEADTPPPFESVAELVEEGVLPVQPTPEEAVVAQDLPERWAFMKATQGTWIGKVMNDSRLQCYGWVDMSYNVSTARSDNTPLVWDYLANEFMMQQAWFRFERPVDTTASGPSWGFRSDWLYGTDYVFTLPRGIFNGQLTANDGEPNTYGVDPITFYGEVYLPNLFQGVNVKVGRYLTPFGVESVEAINSPLVSKSYAFNWSPPFTHTGVFTTVTLTDQWACSLGWALGNDIFIDPANESRFVGTLQWLSPSGRDSVAFGTSVGRGKFNLAEDFNNINVFDIVWIHQFNPRWTYIFEIIYGYQTNAPLPGVLLPPPVELEERAGDALAEEPTTKFGTAHWGSIVNYLLFSCNDKTTLIGRFELFDDFQGSRTGFEGLYTSCTCGVQYYPWKSVLIRPEIRWDHNIESKPFEGKSGIFTAAADVIFRW